MSEEVRAAVFGNVGTMITFRVGAFDAEVLEKEFAPQFTAEDLVNLGFAQIYLKLMIDGVSSTPFSATTMPPIKEPEISLKQQVIEMSRTQFAMNRSLVEQEVLDWHKDNGQTFKKPEGKILEKKPEIAPVKITNDTKPIVTNNNFVKEAEKKEAQSVKVFERPKYVKREDVRPVAMPIPDLPNDDFVSLKDLKPKIGLLNNNKNPNNNYTKKVPDQKSLAELRAVLQSLNKNKTNEVSKPAVEVKDKPKEIPEDKLRQMLNL
jgi:hypothetical protein